MLTTYSATICVNEHVVAHLRDKFDEVTQRQRDATSLQKAQLTILYILEHQTFRKLAKNFAIPKSSVNRFVHAGKELLAEKCHFKVVFDLTLLLQILLAHPQIREKGYVCIDTTLIWTANKYKKKYWSGKHKKTGVKTLVITAPDGTPVWFSHTFPGSFHDMKILRLCKIVQVLELCGIGIVADKGFIGLDKDKHLHPRKKPKGGRLTRMDKEYNYWVTRLRIVVETPFSRLKNIEIMNKCRQRLYNAQSAFEAALGVFALDERSWR